MNTLSSVKYMALLLKVQCICTLVCKSHLILIPIYLPQEHKKMLNLILYAKFFLA